MAAQNALEQLTQPELDAVAIVIGFNSADSGFRNYLREMPPLSGQDLTIGEFARAYLRARLEALRK